MKSLAIVGRPNVGKSALFNRLAGKKISIVHDQPGITRDRLTAICRLGEIPFEIVDTGGIGTEPDPDFAAATKDAAEIAIASADAILFTVDGQSGLTPLDKELAVRLRTTRRPVVVIVNKIDTEKHENILADFAELGFEFCIGVSAAHGRNIRELLTVIENLFSGTELENKDPWDLAPRIAIIGRPNAGKSSLINTILQTQRTIVSELPGTTRDTVDIAYFHRDKPYVLCDTAGIRHRSKHKTSVEVFSVMRSEKTIERADLCLLVLDAQSGVTSQDKKIAGLIQKSRKACVIILNKWDLVKPKEDQRKFLKEMTQEIRRELFFAHFAPLIALSAKTHEHVQRVFPMIEKIGQHAARRVGTGELNRLIQEAMQRQPPPLRANKRLKIYYSTQIIPDNVRPFQTPHFLLFVNEPKLLVDHYRSYLAARIREHWEFPGLPIIFRLRGKKFDNC
ncbi:MAG: ribosome biogenesis GTPase Der [Verrucomicrobia bacterium]|nr:MAG: ribosome biogenesis GTPase Der [Verrucomicrobiota bacterium]